MRKFEDIIIVTDLDGTFIDSAGKQVTRNMEAIKYFTENGGRFTVATGRIPSHLRAGFLNIGEYVNFPAITCNGACFYDFCKDRAVSYHTLPFEHIKAVADIVHREYPNAAVRASSLEYGFLMTPRDFQNPYIIGDIERNSTITTLVSDIEGWQGMTLLKIVVRADEHIVGDIMERLGDKLGDVLAITQSAPTIIDIQVAGVNKGDALRALMSEQGEGTRIYACGDFLNDMEMLRAADVSVCPSNAHPRVRQMCKLCFGTNDDGLIADLIEYLDRE